MGTQPQGQLYDPSDQAKRWTKTTIHFSKISGSGSPDQEQNKGTQDKVLKGCKEIETMPLIVEMLLKNGRPKKDPVWTTRPLSPSSVTSRPAHHSTKSTLGWAYHLDDLGHWAVVACTQYQGVIHWGLQRVDSTSPPDLEMKARDSQVSYITMPNMSQNLHKNYTSSYILQITSR